MTIRISRGDYVFKHDRNIEWALDDLLGALYAELYHPYTDYAIHSEIDNAGCCVGINNLPRDVDSLQESLANEAMWRDSNTLAREQNAIRIVFNLMDKREAALAWSKQRWAEYYGDDSTPDDWRDIEERHIR